MFKAAREFEGQYLECLRVEKVDNKYNKEWRDRLQKEIMRFNGKAVAGGDGYSESISDNTSEGMRSQKAIQQNNRPKSALKAGAQPNQGQQVKFNQSMPKDQDVDDAIAMLNPNAGGGKRKDSGDSLNFRDTGFGDNSHRRNESGSFINPIALSGNEGFDGSGAFDGAHRDAANNFLDDEEKDAEEARRQQEEKKRQNESPYKEFYRDTTGGYYDPAKKFGII